jgi:putative flippase GtrA
MPGTLSTLRARASSPTGKKAIKYTMVSVISVAVSQSVLLFVYGVLDWTAKSSAIFATCVGAVPSYYLNRRWAWGKAGKSHLWREVVPFWVLALLSLAFSTWASDFAGTYVLDHHIKGLLRVTLVDGAFLGSFGVLWVVKFVIFNKFMFTHDDDLQAALANEVVG